MKDVIEIPVRRDERIAAGVKDCEQIAFYEMNRPCLSGEIHEGDRVAVDTGCVDPTREPEMFLLDDRLFGAIVVRWVSREADRFRIAWDESDELIPANTQLGIIGRVVKLERWFLPSIDHPQAA